MLEHLGLKVNRLIRVAYGPFELGELDDGAVEEVETEDVAQGAGAGDGGAGAMRISRGRWRMKRRLPVIPAARAEGRKRARPGTGRSAAFDRNDRRNAFARDRARGPRPSRPRA